MLLQKKISSKKLAISLATIFFMICGTGFMLYKNKQLTASKVINDNSSIVFDNPGPDAETIVPGDDALLADPAADSGQTAQINKIDQGSGLDLNIFSSDKFKNLRANMFTVKEQIEVGKRDPFKPK